MKSIRTRLAVGLPSRQLCYQCQHAIQTKAIPTSSPIRSNPNDSDRSNAQQSSLSTHASTTSISNGFGSISFASQSKSIFSNDTASHYVTLASSFGSNRKLYKPNRNRNKNDCNHSQSSNNSSGTDPNNANIPNIANIASTANILAQTGPNDQESNSLAPESIASIASEPKGLGLRRHVKSLRHLSKWNLSCLNGFVTASSAFACSGGLLSATIPATIGCISLATSASALNQLQEIQFDKLMSRTRLKRPLCNGRLSRAQASSFVFASLATGTGVLYFYCGPAASLIGVSTMLCYNFLYTPLKRLTPYNTEMGAIVGALPPQIGIAASKFVESGGTLSCVEVLQQVVHDPMCWFTFGILFAWQLPHFLYLSIRNKSDYMKGGFKMWSSTMFDDESNSLCKRKSLAWSVVLLPLPAMLAMSGATSMMFAFDGTLVTGAYVASVLKWYYDSSYGRKSFLFNLAYLPLILCLMLLHSKRWKYEKGEFVGTHLAWLQDRGMELCPWLSESDRKTKYEPSKMPPTQIACSSPFRTEIHAEPKPAQWMIENDAEIVELDAK